MLLFLCLLLSICINSEKVFVSCEGNYYDGNQGTLWSIYNDTVYEYNNNPIGSIAQSLYVYNDKLFVIVNGSSNIQIFDILDEGLSLLNIIDTAGSGPREMIVVDDELYFTNWYSMDVKKINLETLEIESSIPMPGLPEDIIVKNNLLYVSIVMNSDWSNGSQVVSIDMSSDTIENVYNVGMGPGDLAILDNDIYISRTYYDSSWNAFYGTSKIGINGDVIMADYGAGAVCGGGIYKFQDSIYRIYNGGIAKLDNNLEIIPETRLGNYNSWEVYSAEVYQDVVYFGLSDFVGNDEVAIVGLDGEELQRYTVGSIPGDFAFWNHCSYDGDLNEDEVLDVLDVVLVSNMILQSSEYSCSADINNDSIINIVDIIDLLQIIL